MVTSYIEASVMVWGYIIILGTLNFYSFGYRVRVLFENLSWPQGKFDVSYNNPKKILSIFNCDN